MTFLKIKLCRFSNAKIRANRSSYLAIPSVKLIARRYFLTKKPPTKDPTMVQKHQNSAQKFACFLCAAFPKTCTADFGQRSFSLI